MSTTVPVYMVECASQQRRGKLLTIYQTSIVFGFFITGIFMAILHKLSYGWRIVASLNILPAAFVLAAMFFLPESPRWLAFQGRESDAYTTYIWIQKTDIGAKEMIEKVKEALYDDTCKFRENWSRELTSTVSLLCV